MRQQISITIWTVNEILTHILINYIYLVNISRYKKMP
jgi:hypothetical protein